MLKDITIGQYFPGQSVVHRLDPRAKLIITLLFVVMLFIAGNLVSLAVGFVLPAAAYLLARIPFKLIVKSLKPIVPILIFTGILNLFFISGEGEPLIHFWVIRIYMDGIAYALFMIVRIVLLIAGTSLLTYTTSPIALTDGLERLMAPLKVIRFPAHELAMMMTIALRFIPTLIEETDRIMSAQKARGGDIDTGGLMKRARALLPILIPLFVSAFKRAEELALAMECRCYRGGEGRTRMKQLKLCMRDWVTMFLTVGMIAGVIVLNRYVYIAF